MRVNKIATILKLMRRAILNRWLWGVLARFKIIYRMQYSHTPKHNQAHTRTPTHAGYVSKDSSAWRRYAPPWNPHFSGWHHGAYGRYSAGALRVARICRQVRQSLAQLSAMKHRQNNPYKSQEGQDCSPTHPGSRHINVITNG